MDELYCVEQGEANEGKGLTVVRAYSTQMVILPHVDSCLGIVCIMSDNTVVTGHALFPFPFDPAEGRPEDIVNKMKREMGNASIEKVICYGDSNYNTQGGSGNEAYTKAMSQLDVPADRIEFRTVNAAVNVIVKYDFGSWDVTTTIY